MLSMLTVVGQSAQSLKQPGRKPDDGRKPRSGTSTAGRPSATTIQGDVMLNRENLENLLTKGGHVVGSDGTKIGSIGQLYADDETGEPTWVTVKTGLFGTSQSFVPVDGARVDGDDLVVPYTKDHVKDAPRVDTDGHLEPEEEDRLYTHYEKGARTYSEARGDAELRDSDYRGDSDLNAGAAAGRGTTAGAVGHDTSGPTTDDAMT